MRAEQCISITELSRNTSGIVNRVPKMGVQYIFSNNKPKAVLLSMEEYNALQEGQMTELRTMSYNEMSDEAKQMYEESKNTPRESFIEF